MTDKLGKFPPKFVNVINGNVPSEIRPNYSALIMRMLSAPHGEIMSEHSKLPNPWIADSALTGMGVRDASIGNSSSLIDRIAEINALYEEVFGKAPGVMIFTFEERVAILRSIYGELFDRAYGNPPEDNSADSSDLGETKALAQSALHEKQCDLLYFLRADTHEMDAKNDRVEARSSTNNCADSGSGIDLTQANHWSSHEDRLRFLIQGGFDLDHVGLPNWIAGEFSDPVVRVSQAVRGQTQRDYEVIWERRGTSEFLTMDQFNLGYEAVAFANCLGLVMNTWITVAWETVGITNDFSVANADGGFRELLRKRITILNKQIREAGNEEKEFPVAWLWVLERSKKRGLHGHLLAHVPEVHRKWIKMAVAECVITVAKRPLVIEPDTKTVVVKTRHDSAIGPQWKWFRYMMKGIIPGYKVQDPDQRNPPMSLREVMAMDRMDPQGLIRTQRFGVSRALGRLTQVRFRKGKDLPDTNWLNRELNAAAIFDNRFYQWSRHPENEKQIRELLNTLAI